MSGMMSEVSSLIIFSCGMFVVLDVYHDLIQHTHTFSIRCLHRSLSALTRRFYILCADRSLVKALYIRPTCQRSNPVVKKPSPSLRKQTFSTSTNICGGTV